MCLDYHTFVALLVANLENRKLHTSNVLWFGLYPDSSFVDLLHFLKLFCYLLEEKSEDEGEEVDSESEVVDIQGGYTSII